MSALVRKSPSVLVRPSEPVSISTTIELSSFDKGLDKMPVTAFLMFEHPIHDVASTIKRALSQALVHYYPVAGRIVAGAGDGVGEVHIQCNGEGVAFVSASADCALKNVMSLDRSQGAGTLLDELTVLCSAKGFGPTDPLLMMQVTEFTCGGFVVGVTWNHAVADGAGMGQFLQAVGELARGLPSPSTAPIRWDDSLWNPPPMTREPMQRGLKGLDPFHDLVWIEITIPSRLIHHIKAEFSSRFAGQPCSKFEAASAVLWQCRTRAIMCSPETPALFLFTANVRNHVGAKQGYYGNCITAQFVVATSGTVANGDVIDLVKMIKDSKEKIADQFKKKEEDNPQQQAEGQTQQAEGQGEQLGQLRYNMLYVSSWGNLGLDEADFGSGRPARVTTSTEGKPCFPQCIMCLPCKAKDGVDVLSAMVKEEHVDAFLGEFARLS